MRIWDDSLEREFRSLRSQNRAQKKKKKKNVEGINSGLGPWIQRLTR